MTNLFGTAAPEIGVIPAADAGPLQLGLAARVAVPCVVTKLRFYVASTLLAAQTGGSLPYQVWRDGEPASVIAGTLTIPGTVGWVEGTLSTPLSVPANRIALGGVSLPSGSPISYGATFNSLPRSNALLTGLGSKFYYQAGTIVSTFPYSGGLFILTTNYMIDLEVAVSEMINLDPAALAVADVITVRRNTTGTVTAITPITDALTVAVDVVGGPLDGTNVDVWIPDTAAGLAAADMKLLKELPDPGVGTRWEASAMGGGDGSLWVYHGGGQYGCFQDGTSFREGAYTTRADTPSLIAWP